MKKLLIASGIISAIVITGCATSKTADTANDDQARPAHKHEHKHGKPPHDKKMHQHEQGAFTENYTCDNNAKITANYDPDADKSVLNITAPTLSLNGAEVTMQIAPSASGTLFVNHTNPQAKYEWHAKGKFAMLEVTTDKGQTQTIKCEGQTPMHEHGPMQGHPKPPKHGQKPASESQASE